MRSLSQTISTISGIVNESNIHMFFGLFLSSRNGVYNFFEVLNVIKALRKVVIDYTTEDTSSDESGEEPQKGQTWWLSSSFYSSQAENLELLA